MSASISVGGTAATVVAYPPSGGLPHAYIFNSGPWPAHLGDGPGVSSATGFRLMPQCRADVALTSGTIWAVAGGNQIAPYGTITAMTSYPGGTALAVAAGGAAFTAGMTVIIEAGTPRQEVTSVASSNAGTVNVSPAMIFAHAAAAVFSQYAPNVTTLQVTPGST